LIFVLLNKSFNVHCTAKVILLAKMIKLWTFYENVVTVTVSEV